jgi:hypothetical protein
MQRLHRQHRIADRNVLGKMMLLPERQCRRLRLSAGTLHITTSEP